VPAAVADDASAIQQSAAAVTCAVHEETLILVVAARMLEAGMSVAYCRRASLNL